MKLSVALLYVFATLVIVFGTLFLFAEFCHVDFHGAFNFGFSAQQANTPACGCNKPQPAPKTAPPAPAAQSITRDVTNVINIIEPTRVVHKSAPRQRTEYPSTQQTSNPTDVDVSVSVNDNNNSSSVSTSNSTSNSDSNSNSNSDSNTSSNSSSNSGGSDYYSSPGGIVYEPYQVSTYSSPGGITYTGPGAATYTSPGGETYNNTPPPTADTYSSPGGTTYTGPGAVSDYTGPGAESVPNPDANTNGTVPPPDADTYSNTQSPDANSGSGSPSVTTTPGA